MTNQNETNITIRTCYCLDDITKIEDSDQL